MNRRLLRGGVAALAAVLLAAGGATYAALSDVEGAAGNDVAAGRLDLRVAAGGVSGSLDRPGSATTGSYRVENAEATTTGSTDVHLLVAALETADNGCAYPEKRVRRDDSEWRAEGGACESPGDPGELQESTDLRIERRLAPGGGDCGRESTLVYSGTVGGASRSFTLGPPVTLAPGDAACYDYILSLPEGASDAAQTDSFALTLRWTTERPEPR